MQAHRQRASRGSQDVDAKRTGQAEQCYLRGHALRKQGKLAEAAAAFSQALELAPSHFKALFNRAFVLDRVSPSLRSSEHRCLTCVAERAQQQRCL